MAGSERQRELRRRRQRRKKLQILKRKLEKASSADKATIIEKIRNLTPGAGDIIRNWGLDG